MTDEEMNRLEELAKGAMRGGFLHPSHLEFTESTEPTAVLALIERVRKAEKKLDAYRKSATNLRDLVRALDEP